MKTTPDSYLKQLRDELALAKTSIDNKFTPEPQRNLLRNSIIKLLEKIKGVERKIARQKGRANKKNDSLSN